MLIVLGVCDQGTHFVKVEDALGSLVVMFGTFAAFELTEGIDGDAAFSVSLGEDDRERTQDAGDRPAFQSFVA